MTIKIEERSLQLALVRAAGQLGITQESLGYRVISKNKGFLGVFGKKVAIEAWVKNGKNQHGSQRNSQPLKEDRKELADMEISELKKDLKQFCQTVCKLMTGEDVTVEIYEEDSRLIFDIDNDYLCTQAAKNPKLAESFEHILRKKPRYLRQELPFRIFVDFRGVRLDRENELVDMAQDLSDKVHENKRPIVLNYRSSYDRKIIHMALDKDSRVYTKSIGSGPNRKLMILPNTKEQTSEANL